MHNGTGPWPCFLESCDELVHYEDPGFSVHHIDEDDSNNDPSNLAAIHRNCHSAIPHKKRLEATVAANTRRRHTEEARAKMSAASRALWSGTRGEKTRELMREYKRAEWAELSLEERSARSKPGIEAAAAANRGRVGHNRGKPSPLRGRKMSDAARRKMSEAAKRRASTEEGRARLVAAGRRGAESRWRPS